MAGTRRKAARLAVALAISVALSGVTLSEETQSPAASAPGRPPASKPESGSAAPKSGAPAVVVGGQDLEGVLGEEALSRKGEKMGQIVDVLADHDGNVRAAIIDFGGFLGVGSRKIAVDWRAVHFVPGNKSIHIMLDLTKEDVLGSHEYKPGEKVTILQPAPVATAPQK